GGNENGAMDPAVAPPGSSTTAASRCSIAPTSGDVTCTHETTTIGGRTVVYQTPIGVPPANGWPVVIMLHGSFARPRLSGSAAGGEGPLAKFAVRETRVIKALLDTGYAVIPPPADGNALAWDTNIPPWDFDWPPAPDNLFMLRLFSAIDDGELGALSRTRWF